MCDTLFILYQAVPYVGIAKVFDFLHATNDVLQGKGINLPLDGQSTTTPETRYEKGLALPAIASPAFRIRLRSTCWS